MFIMNNAYQHAHLEDINLCSLCKIGKTDDVTNILLPNHGPEICYRFWFWTL